MFANAATLHQNAALNDYVNQVVAQGGTLYQVANVSMHVGAVPLEVPSAAYMLINAIGGVDVFVGVEIDAVGAIGFEGAIGLVFDLDHPLESGVYVNLSLAGGANVGKTWTLSPQSIINYFK